MSETILEAMLIKVARKTMSIVLTGILAVKVMIPSEIESTPSI